MASAFGGQREAVCSRLIRAIPLVWSLFKAGESCPFLAGPRNLKRKDDEMTDAIQTDQSENGDKNELVQHLEIWCAAEFPYVCTGIKTVSDDGLDVKCECGSRLKV